jgi:hypothetical protein
VYSKITNPGQVSQAIAVEELADFQVSALENLWLLSPALEPIYFWFGEIPF